MKASEFKEYLLEDIERVEKVLESIGCHKIWRAGGEIRSAPPDGENHTSVSVNLDTLYSRVYAEGETFRGDIIALAQHFRKESFSDTFRYLRSLFGLSGRFVKDDKIDILSTFKNIRKQHRVIKNIDELDVPKFGMESLDGFVVLPHMRLFYEGITTQTQELFKVAYDSQLDRIIFPHFNYDDVNTIVGITGRTLATKEVMEQFNIPKYWNYIRGYKKSQNIYGFSHSVENLKDSGILFIFEGEKSVQKQFSQTRNKGYSCSVGSHEISDIQVQIILQNTPAETEVIIGFDKDVMENEEYLVEIAKKFSKYRKASYIMDNKDFPILDSKDSPIDKGVKAFNHLVKYRKSV